MSPLADIVYRASRDRRATLFVTLLTVISYGVTLLRERANAMAFGTSGDLDAYLVAVSVISLIAITPSRALYEGLILATASRGQRESEAAAATARAAVGVGTLALVAVSVAALAAAPVLVRLIAPDMSSSRILEAEELARSLIPMIIALGVWEIVRGVLHGYHEFFSSSVLPIIAPLVTFVTVTTLNGVLGIHALVLGSLLGTGLQAVVGLVVLVRLGIPLALSRSLFDLRSLRAIQGPATASSILAAVAMLWVSADRFLASSLPEGRIAALNYASSIYAAASVVAITGTATVAFPRLAQSAQAGTAQAFTSLLKRGVLDTAIVSLPMTILLVAFAQPLVHLLLGSGRFDAVSERVTAESLVAYLVFLPLIAPASVIARSVYALGLLRLIVAQSVLVLVAKVGLGLILRDSFQHVGVAAASGVATIIVGAVVLVAALRAARDLRTPAAAEADLATDLPPEPPHAGTPIST